jgi:hypothetical protein
MEGNQCVCLFGLIVMDVFVEEPVAVVGIWGAGGEGIDVFEWIYGNGGTLEEGKPVGQFLWSVF